MPAHSCMAMRSGPENRMYGASTHINWSEPSVPESQRGTADAKKDFGDRGGGGSWRRYWDRQKALVPYTREMWGTSEVLSGWSSSRAVQWRCRAFLTNGSPLAPGDSPTCPKFEAYSFFGLK